MWGAAPKQLGPPSRGGAYSAGIVPKPSIAMTARKSPPACSPIKSPEMKKIKSERPVPSSAAT